MNEKNVHTVLGTVSSENLGFTLPQLQARGVGEDTVAKVTVSNPARIFALAKS